jgi:hypothetical protein
MIQTTSPIDAFHEYVGKTISDGDREALCTSVSGENEGGGIWHQKLKLNWACKLDLAVPNDPKIKTIRIYESAGTLADILADGWKPADDSNSLFTRDSEVIQ